MILKKFRLLPIGILLISFSCSPYRNVGVVTADYYNDNNHFRSLDFVKSFNSIIDSNSINIFSYSRYSPNKKYHIETTFKPFFIGGYTGKCTSYLKIDSLQLQRIKWTLIGEKTYWLDSTLVFFGYNGSPEPYSRKISVNLNDFSTNYLPSKGKFMYLGRSRDKYFFETLKEEQSIGEFYFPDAHTIISIGDNKVQIERVTIDTTYQFYNGIINLFYDPDNNDYLKSNNEDFEPIKIKNPYVYTYWTNDTSYILIDRNKLLKIFENQIETITSIDMSELKINNIDDFVIYKNKLILSYYKNYPINNLNEKKIITTNNGLIKKHPDYDLTYKEIAIIDLKTNEIKYPKINIINK